ncbi:hypothetical protein K466DRAFT_644107 [Polyporus arcularius HHB13444]|uniref:Diacylglycerol O-acyltransferase n=1 Tax=Polyporus arcularius HHB13444 TaxID=1314778 RepID=A0A5C3PPN0_9APHY|nr:hypothetical protein K466DRAFT_644107 [Polyporus arcularius HHB13444]
MSWSLVSSSSPSSGRTYARPLGLNEASFYYDRIFNGTADIIWRYVVEETDHARGTSLFSEENVRRAWATLKQWYPLLGVRMDDSDGMDAVKFVVSEQAVTHHQPDEVTLRTVSSPAEVEALIWRLLRDEPMSDHHLISRVFVFGFQERPGTYEVLFKAAHSIADGISGATIARTFFHVLTSPPAPIPPLQERLEMALPCDQLNPTNKMTLARQRWRHAIARVTFLNRRRKLAGGHTLPRKATDTTYRTPSVTDRGGSRFSVSESAAILATCKRHRLTFGAVIPVISQLAITRMLHRRYLRGEIPEDEWEYRRRQPMHFGGPINLRPYMDEEWQRKGGATEVALAIDYYECTLPFMPTPFGTRKDEGVPRVDGAPPFSALMSRGRFFYRSRLFRAQLQRRVKHPLMLDIALARQPVYLLRKKTNVTHWIAAQRGEPLPTYAVPPHFDSVPSDYVPANGLSSVGQMSLILPETYPLPPGHPLSVHTAWAANPSFGAVGEASASKARPAVPPVTADSDALLRIVNENTYLHSRPFEFFLGNATERNQISMFLTFDANVYNREDAGEFLRECREAALYYLGDSGIAKAKL